MDLDFAIRTTFLDFGLPSRGLMLNPVVAGAFCRVVIRHHRAIVAHELILSRMLDLERRGLLEPLHQVG
jgi:hypothetical protein